MDQHRADRESLGGVAVLDIDYGYLNDETLGVVDAAGAFQRDGGYPFLAIKDAVQRWIAGHIVPSKGADACAIEVVLTEEILGSGHPEVELKSDQKPAVLAMKEAAATKARLKGARVRLTEAALREPK